MIIVNSRNWVVGISFMSALRSGWACALQPDITIQQVSVQFEIMLRNWNTKSFTSRRPHDVISVITAHDLRGDIVILRWNPDGRQFSAEIYIPEQKPGPRASWLFKKDDKTKTLNRQPNGEFYISEIVAGAEGGQQVEVFRLPENMSEQK